MVDKEGLGKASKKEFDRDVRERQTRDILIHRNNLHVGRLRLIRTVQYVRDQTVFIIIVRVTHWYEDDVILVE